MKVRIAALAIALQVLLVHVALASAADSLEQRADQKFEANRKTEVTVRYHHANTAVTFKDQFIPIRFLFGRSTDQINWNNHTKTASVLRNGKQLILATKSFNPSKKQVVWPHEWFVFKDGTNYVNVMYLNQIFDRYGKYEADSEEQKWAQKLGFLGITYIDSIYGGKDGIQHVFVMFDEQA
ncbi:hypothetical protein [Paenibacillus sp. OV219]|uniref:hypothetical protein n=1 Tax=Paenibacillus sp. OV219 TaxID=1884377 RepID=UPI0008C8322C|nr:hypothetical protein [Paenibacillus sp. OV219]SEO35527.1 hypothetical protein SAMN05518847_107181 [Paenibacillus sp. OV219]